PEVIEDDLVEADVAEEPVRAPSAGSLRELVRKTSTDFSLSEQMRCLAGTVYFEARGEPLAGQLAVAKVVMNRSDDRRFPNSYCGVVYQRSQFSFVRGGRMPRINTGSAAWKRAKAIARIAHESQWDSAADDSLYFHAKYVRPSWSRKKSKRATINTHIFYR
ncbi:MAG: cell wall hydrolase, partial [Marinomonas sp.]